MIGECKFTYTRLQCWTDSHTLTPRSESLRKVSQGSEQSIRYLSQLFLSQGSRTKALQRETRGLFCNTHSSTVARTNAISVKKLRCDLGVATPIARFHEASKARGDGGGTIVVYHSTTTMEDSLFDCRIQRTVCPWDNADDAITLLPHNGAGIQSKAAAC